MMPTDQPSGSIHTLHIHLQSINIAISAQPAEQPNGTAPFYLSLFRIPKSGSRLEPNEPIVTLAVISRRQMSDDRCRAKSTVSRHLSSVICHPSSDTC